MVVQVACETEFLELVSRFGEDKPPSPIALENVITGVVPKVGALVGNTVGVLVEDTVGALVEATVGAAEDAGAVVGCKVGAAVGPGVG
jgi:hypothetical protein